MGKIIMSENVSLDGVIEDPAGDEGFRVGGWVGRIADRPEVAKATLDETLAADVTGHQAARGRPVSLRRGVCIGGG